MSYTMISRARVTDQQRIIIRPDRGCSAEAFQRGSGIDRRRGGNFGTSSYSGGGPTTATAGKRKQPNKPCINSGVTRTDIATHRTPRSTVTLLITSEDRFDIPLSGNYCQHPTITSLLDRPSGGNRQQQHNNFSSNRKLQAL